MRDLGSVEVLQNARELVRAVYHVSARLPDAERYGLVSQTQRAATSIALNIAEGFGRGTQGDLERSLRIASGSAAELETALRLIEELYGIGVYSTLMEVDVVRRRLNVLTRRVSDSRRLDDTTP